VAPVIQSLVSAQAKSMMSPPRGSDRGGNKGRGRGQGGGTFKYWITCYICGQAGHYQADCPNGQVNPHTGQPALPPPAPLEPPPPGLEIKGGGRGGDKGNGGRGPGG
jgi:hypothetical protein